LDVDLRSRSKKERKNVEVRDGTQPGPRPFHPNSANEDTGPEGVSTFDAVILSENVLDIRALTRHFGSFTAVDSLTLSVGSGEVFGLLGTNGAGKTTTIKMLVTLLPPTSGDASVAGFSITTQAVGVRRSIGYVPQAVSVDGSLTGFENLLIFAKLYDLPGPQWKPRILEALAFMGLTQDANRPGWVLVWHRPSVSTWSPASPRNC